ncbi:MAG: UDP-N-acetylmuramoyl-tripeptide--D-alanyl-D-alanine ligase [Candidatus Berkelbacteria bacterium Licking1014_96]|uniref:UDP-N-acetylmuramoyl-tripeptide--D-alanyl-D-alanine ligase n=1 Tax=Candidatus Berkelbacteria bacterium Licking1014_96 TaxID=2017149 RepID=A0A554LFN4_9BACT|nr:MAG: UDP-N-acetylmuramoyl-tripeptide--D-alanyl-D-alanine ligase [Candidatus Berkelbacteria bacterium Licking1014_96]
MRQIALKIIQFKLKIIAKLFLARYQPKIIGITGSVGKSSTKEAIYTVLRAEFDVRRSRGSYNNEIGAPLTILGDESPGSNIWGWIILFFRALINLIYDKDYPSILILEMGVDKPADLDYLLGFIKPKIAVITAIAPAHLEAMKSEDEIFSEKSKLALALPKAGTAILNFDDERLRRLGLSLSSKVLFYGLNDQAQLSASEIKDEERSVIFNLNYAGSVVPARINSLGRGQIYAVLAACAVAVTLKMDLITASKELLRVKPLKGRLKIFPGKKETTLIDDSYNSNPVSAQAAIETAKIFKENGNYQRLVLVLGEMLELGSISRRAHLNLGREAAKVADLVITVGDEAKNISSNFWFRDSEALSKKILALIKPGDLILIKGSQGVRMEKVSRVLLKNKPDIKHLPRMSGYWEGK